MALFQTPNLWINPLGDDAALLMLDVKGKTNHVHEPLLRDLDHALEFLVGEKVFTRLVLASAKDGVFCLGFDDATWQSLKDPKVAADLCELGQLVCTKLQALPIPTLAWIAGPCVGAGLELALACDERVVVENVGAFLSVPDIEFGMLPGFGGVSRLARLIGLERTFQMVIGSRKLMPREALAWGFADHLRDDVTPLRSDLPRNLSKRAENYRVRKTWRQWLLESHALGRRVIFRKMEHVLKGRLPDGLDAPRHLIRILRIEDRDDALLQTRASFPELAQKPAFANLQRLQNLRRTALGRATERPRLGIVGASGKSMALMQTATLKGCQVVFREKDETALGLTVFKILQNLNGDVRRGLLSGKEAEAALSRIHSTVSWKGFSDVDLVLFASDADRAGSLEEMHELAEQVHVQCPIVSLSAWHSLEQLQTHVKNPQRLARAHFPTPIGKIPLVEIHTNELQGSRTLEAVTNLARALGKAPIPVRDQPGFLLERLWYPAWNEILILLSEGLTPARIDRILFQFGMIFSPLEYLDLIGIDLAFAHALVMKPIFGSRIPPDDSWEMMLERKFLGQKTGVGFYRYRKDTKTENRYLAASLQQASDRRVKFASPAEETQHVVDRVVGLTINEAFRCVEEGIVADADALDLAMMLSGWAPHRGGPIRFAKGRDWGAVLADLATEFGERFTPCASLQVK